MTFYWKPTITKRYFKGANHIIQERTFLKRAKLWERLKHERRSRAGLSPPFYTIQNVWLILLEESLLASVASSVISLCRIFSIFSRMHTSQNATALPAFHPGTFSSLRKRKLRSTAYNSILSLRASSRAWGLGFCWGKGVGGRETNESSRSFPSPTPFPQQKPKPQAREVARRL